MENKNSNTARNVILIVIAIVLLTICCCACSCLAIIVNPDFQTGFREGYCESMYEEGYRQDPAGLVDCD